MTDIENFRNEVRDFLSRELTPELRKASQLGFGIERQEGSLWHKKLYEAGWIAPSWPVEFGGTGWSETQKHVFDNECALAGAPMIMPFGIGMVGPVIYTFGTEEQKQQHLPQILDGSVWWCQGYSEPGSGSDLASLKTRAVRDGDEYVINGTKRYITNAPEASLFTVFARTAPKADGVKGISALLVEGDIPGITIGRWDRKMGQRGAHTADVTFTDCRVSADALISGAEGVGFKTAMKVLDRGRIHIGAVCVATAERLIDDSLRYAMERQQFGQPIAEFQLIQAMLADSRAETYAARCMVEETARRRDSGLPVVTEASCCKLFCAEMVGRVADRAVQIHGGAGYMAEYGIERFYRDVRLFRIYEGTSQIQQLVIARNMMREAAE